MDLFPSLCLLPWFPCPLFVFSSVAPAVTDMDEMPEQHSFTSTLFTPFSPLFFLHGRYSFLLIWDWQRTLFQFLQEMSGRHFHFKRNHRIMNKIRNTLNGFFYIRKTVMSEII